MILTIDQKQLPPDITVLEMGGRIIMGNNSRDVELKLNEVLNDHAKKIIFDLTNLSMIDSTGIGILVVCQARIKKQGGELRIAGAQGVVDDILRMTSVDKLVHLFPTAAEAAAHF